LKFKYAIIIFNIIIVFFLSAAVLIPLFLFGAAFAENIWRSVWPLVIVLFAALIILNGYFLLNYRLFALLEREDWPALVDFLECKILRGGHYSSRQARLLINSYLVMGDSAAVTRLENRIAIAKPALLEKNALVFGAARILGGDSKGAADFFQVRLEKGKPKSEGNLWLRWYYGFSLVLAGAGDKAGAEFAALAVSSGDVLIAGLSAYLLSTIPPKLSANAAEWRTLAERGAEQARTVLKNIDGWKKEAAKVESEVHAAIIKKYINEAGEWLFGT
jgi:hypothetical protein